MTTTITVPTSAQIGEALESIARRVAIAIAIAIVMAQATYNAGYAFGRIVHNLNDWLADASHTPMATATATATSLVAWADRILTPTAPDLITVLGAQVLSETELQAEIVAYDTKTKKRPVSRRKPATARKSVAVA